MKPKRLNYLVSRLNHFELTRCEKRYLKLLVSYFMEKRQLTDEQEMILQGLYSEKLRWAKLGFIREKGSDRRR